MKKNQRRPTRNIRDLLSRIKRFLMSWAEPSEPEDPYAYSMATLRRPPSKGGATAVAELDESDLGEE